MRDLVTKVVQVSLLPKGDVKVYYDTDVQEKIPIRLNLFTIEEVRRTNKAVFLSEQKTNEVLEILNKLKYHCHNLFIKGIINTSNEKIELT